MRASALAVAFSVCACGPQDLAGLTAPDAPPVTEVAHTVSVQFLDGAVHLTVKRTLRNDSQTHQSLTHRLLLPEGAAVTQLRVGPAGQFAEKAALNTTEEANARWDLLRSPGNATPATLGLLEWEWDDALQLQLFGLAPLALVDVQYELDLPATYDAGELSFDYPLEEPEAGWLEPTFEAGLLNRVATDVGEDPSVLHVRRAWATREVVDARWATFPIDSKRTLWRLELDTAAELERAPVRPSVVFVVDASHSEGEPGIAAQLELIAPYLANAADAQVEVVLYRRSAERLFGRFVNASDVARQLAQVPKERLTPGNGSHLEVGAQLAALALREVGGVGRVVLFTDELLREGFRNELAIEALREAPSGTVAHVVERGAVWGEQLSETRDDTASLAPIAESTGGIFLRVGGHAGDPVLAADTLRGLVRPVRIDSFEVKGDEDLEGQLQVDAELNEGVGFRQFAIGEEPPAEIVLTGKIWSRPYRRVVKLDATLSQRLPAFAVGDDSVRTSLSEDELLTTAFVAQAVSPVTSFLAAPREAAPSTIGVELLGGVGGLGTRGVGCSGCGGSTSCGWGTAHSWPNLEPVLRALLAPVVSACEARLGSTADVSLRLEATRDEVVDVTVSGGSDAMNACLTEGAWAIRLSPDFKRTHAWTLQY